MPLELGIDYGCREFGGADMATKKFLILEEKKYRYQAAISDLAGCDIETHAGDFTQAIGKVRSWLVNEAVAKNVGTTRLISKYADFQAWYWACQERAGASDGDIKKYPTKEILTNMKDWLKNGEPLDA